jgi:hypothetical protein
LRLGGAARSTLRSFARQKAPAQDDGILLKRWASDDGVFWDQDQRQRARAPALHNFDETWRGLLAALFFGESFGGLKGSYG